VTAVTPSGPPPCAAQLSLIAVGNRRLATALYLALRPGCCLPSGWRSSSSPVGIFARPYAKERPPPRGVSVFHAVAPHCRMALCSEEPGARAQWAEPSATAVKRSARPWARRARTMADAIRSVWRTPSACPRKHAPPRPRAGRTAAIPVYCPRLCSAGFASRPLRNAQVSALVV